MGVNGCECVGIGGLARGCFDETGVLMSRHLGEWDGWRAMVSPHENQCVCGGVCVVCMRVCVCVNLTNVH